MNIEHDDFLKSIKLVIELATHKDLTSIGIEETEPVSEFYIIVRHSKCGITYVDKILIDTNNIDFDRTEDAINEIHDRWSNILAVDQELDEIIEGMEDADA